MIDINTPAGASAARSRMRRHLFHVAAGCLAILIVFGSSTIGRAQEEFVFAHCQSTGKHVAVRFHNDHFVLHFHVRVRGMAGKPFFARVRTQVGNEQEAKIVSQEIILLTAVTDSDLWSVKMRVPRFASSANQNSAVYQLELGPHDRLLVDEFVLAETFAWKITRDAQGMGEMEGLESGIPYAVRIPVIEGSRVVIKSEYRVRAALVDIDYGFSNNIDLGSNNYEQSAERIGP